MIDPTPLSTALLACVLVFAVGGRARRHTVHRSPEGSAAARDAESQQRQSSGRISVRPKSTRVFKQLRRPIGTSTLLIAGIWILGVLFMVAIIVAGLAYVRVRRILRSREQSRLRIHDLPSAIESLVLGVHAGLTPVQAVRELSTSIAPSLQPAFGEVVHRIDRGVPFSDALAVLNEFIGPASAGLVEVLGAADRYGSPLGPVLEQLSAEARQQRRRLDEADARKLPVRLSFPLVVCTLPSFVLLAIAPAVIAAISSLGESSW